MATESTDPIRDLLAGLPPAMFLGNPSDTVAIWESKIVDAGADPEVVLAWVREHGGYPDKSYSVVNRKGFNLRDQVGSKRFFVVPQDALA